eukprot:TRINITY_DN4116_c0_g2_i11.p1 TRINITY_DN4116_c0_g2~~TRINITY_DN4116_c0_g2_i11.p1  ORF type:complete len:147 (+),score=26.47 TRINITY_DN4116_c0_g2_i11:118-558(+)
MNCFNCKLSYNDSERIPRLLVHCGHSLCETCAVSLHSDGFIICPECRMYNYTLNIANLPKNLALLHLKPTPSTPPAPSPSQNIRNTKPISSPTIDPNEAKCTVHGKPVEAFCERERVVLCITCILEDGHKSHELVSVAQAAEKERA